MDPEKSNEMSLKDKRQLVYEVSRWPQSAAEILQCWTRRDLLELICAELGKERKYTNVPKSKMIAYLLKLVSRNNGQLKDDSANAILSGQDNKNDTQTKENGEQSQHLSKSVNSDSSTRREARAGSSVICRNVACQAKLNAGDSYCKRCSCCICHKYDENKDPSLWLVCSSDNPYSGCSCGMSCHLKCALKNKKTGILKNGCNKKLDCSFYCVCCGKINWLMRSLRKQLAIARESRRVDVLCERLSLSHNMVKGSEHYQELANIICSAVKTLEKEVGGALDQVSAIMGRRIVNRLSCGADVQKLCSCALEIVHSTVDNTLVFESNNNLKPLSPQPQIFFEEINLFSVVIVLKYQDNVAKEHIDGCKVWHRSAKVHNYPSEPTCCILRPNTKTLVSGLSPSTEYFFKVLPFGSKHGFGEWEVKCATRSLDRGSSQCSTQNSDSVCLREDSMQHQNKDLNLQNHQRAIQYDSPKGSTNSSENNVSSERYSKRAKFARLDGASDNDESQLPPTSEVLPFTSSNSSHLEPPSKPDLLSNTPDSASKNYLEQQYEYCVKVIRWLECEGHMDNDFRVAFLTWFSLKATAQDRRIVSAFVDALISDPASLVAQLVDAFTDVICIKEKPAQPQRKRACCKLWH
ncbi:VIN3-like protein 2 isoform X2 [Phragmites australis]|nr:VIN3-like protein 2 isoform X2 [Phragmites australis]XP_062191814.1 VIN3-like protein 2 isoform X2 [Phragmites australis]XP_062191815.1 VIN3-like protein 2 isoform X2 [Phragmites australis]